jgi:hypothetical protein
MVFVNVSRCSVELNMVSGGGLSHICFLFGRLGIPVAGYCSGFSTGVNEGCRRNVGFLCSFMTRRRHLWTTFCVTHRMFLCAWKQISVKYESETRDTVSLFLLDDERYVALLQSSGPRGGGWKCRGWTASN